MGPSTSVSRDITAKPRVSVFSELASFLAMEHTADEEGVDTFLERHPKTRHALSAEDLTQLAFLPSQRPATPESNDLSSVAGDSQRSDGSHYASAVRDTAVARRGISDMSVWVQQHIGAIAQRTGDADFIDLTRRMLSFNMSPIVFVASLRDITPPVARADGTTKWQCPRCGKKHEAALAQCLRCRHGNANLCSLFVGQLWKEVACEETLRKVLHATVPSVDVVRIDGHRDSCGRGRGCATLCVPRRDAEAVCSIHSNVFLDVDVDDPSRDVVLYVYPEQREWLMAFAAARARSVPKRPAHLPRGVLNIGGNHSAV
jgi:hypothetical protein